MLQQVAYFHPAYVKEVAALNHGDGKRSPMIVVGSIKRQLEPFQKIFRNAQQQILVKIKNGLFQRVWKIGQVLLLQE